MESNMVTEKNLRSPRFQIKNPKIRAVDFDDSGFRPRSRNLEENKFSGKTVELLWEKSILTRKVTLR